MASSKTRELTLMAIFTAILLVGQVALGFLPNIEVVSLLIILYTIHLKKKVFFVIYAFVLLEGLIYGFGLWWINYLYIWSILALLALCFQKQTSVFFWSLLSGFYGMGFGALCSIPYFFLSGTKAAFAYWVSGLIYDIPHCIGNVIICMLLFKPLNGILEKAVCSE